MVNAKVDIPSTVAQGLTIGYTFIAVCLTVFRLAARKRSRWWWDDLFAAIGMVAIVLQCIILWLRIKRVPVLMKNQTANIAVFYLNSMCLYLEDWMARLSILGSIIRIAPSDWLKIRLKFMGVFFVLAGVGNAIILIATCEHNTDWHRNRVPPRCKLVESVPIYRIVTGIFVDAVLVITPIRVLQGLKSAPQLKRRLIIIFCASLFMTLACIVQSVITITLPGDPELIASLTEGFVALVTCNLTITVTALFRLAGAKNGLEADIGRTGFTQPPSAIQFRTFVSTPAVSQPPTDESAKNTLPDSGYSHNGGVGTGLTSSFTDDDRRSTKDDSEEQLETLEFRPNQSFMERWRSLDVDSL